MPFNIGPLELIIVLVIALLVVGPRRLPEMGNALGKTIREFRKASSDITDSTSLEPNSSMDDPPAPNTLRGEARPNTMSGTTPGAAATPKTHDDA